MNILKSSLLVITLPLVVSRLTHAASPEITAIRGGRILSMNGPEIQEGVVLITDGKITAVGRDVVIPSGARIIEAKGQWVMPGLVNTHTTVGLAEDRDHESTDELSDPNTAQLRVLDGLNPFNKEILRLLRSGVTTALLTTGRANVIGAQAAVIKLWGRTADEMALRSPAGVKLSFGEGPKSAFGKKGRLPQTRMGNAFIIRKALLDAADYGKKWKDHEAKAKSKGTAPQPPKTDLALEPLARMLEGRLTAYIEAYRADDIVTALRLVDEFKLKAVLIGATEGDLVANEISRRKIPVIVGSLGLGAKRTETERAELELAARLAKVGLEVALQTEDSFGIGAAEEFPMVAALAVKGGLPRDAALRSITLTAAEVLGVADRVGSL
ncbi:MAG: amidohydrolase, partial [Spirochaetota bacterium]